MPNNVQTGRSLIRIYARLKGELDKAKYDEDVLIEAKRARAYIRHIVALMPLLNVDFEPSSIKAVRTRVRIGPLPHGGMRKGALAVLKQDGGYMNYRDLANGILARSKKVLDVADMRDFVQKLREALFFMSEKGSVVYESPIKFGAWEKNQRVKLSPTLFRQAD